MPRSSQYLVNGMTVEQLLDWHRATFGDARMDDVPEKPDDVTQEEWDALGDPGRRAIDRVKRAQREADRARDAAIADKAKADKEAADAKAALDKAKPDPPKKEDPPADVDERIKQAVASAVEQVTKTYTEKLDALRAENTAKDITAQAQRIAADFMVDPALVGTFVNLSTVLDAQGQLDAQALKDGLAKVIEERPYLKKPDAPDLPGGNPFGGHPGGARPPSDKGKFDAQVAAQLDLARQNGLAVRSDLAKAATSTT